MTALFPMKKADEKWCDLNHLIYDNKLLVSINLPYLKIVKHTSNFKFLNIEFNDLIWNFETEGKIAYHLYQHLLEAHLASKVS